MMWTGTWNGWGGGFVMLLSMVVFWGGVIWAIGYAIRKSSDPAVPGSDAPSATQILENRFARGEIDSDEFDERRRILNGPAASGDERAGSTTTRRLGSLEMTRESRLC